MGCWEFWLVVMGVTVVDLAVITVLIVVEVLALVVLYRLGALSKEIVLRVVRKLRER